MFITKRVTGIFAVAVLAGCSSPVKVNDTALPDRPLAAAPTAPVWSTRDVAPVQTGSTDPLNDPRGVLAQRSVFFDYDSYRMRGDARSVVESHAGYLVKNPARRIIIQGNTDERGGTEYNLALGQKRAEAVRKSLAVLGATASQMEAVSLGETKPAATGTDEAASAKNRRSDIVY